MKEVIEFRIDERKAHAYLPHDLGTRKLVTVRQIVLPSDDPWVDRLAKLDSECRKQGVILIPSCWFKRTYSRSELAAARLLQIKPTRYFEPAGEECGTVYDDSVACPVCYAGGILRSPLRLRATSIPQRADIAMSIAEEVVFSQRFAEVLIASGLGEHTLEPVEFNKGPASTRPWYRPASTVALLEVSRPFRAGANPINGIDPPYGRCERGDTLGLNLLSELYVERLRQKCEPLYRTRQYFGHRMGLLRPAPKWVISSDVRQRIESAGLKGFKFEVVHEV